MLSLQSLTPSEEQSIKLDQRKAQGKALQEVAFHTDISVERMDIVIQQLIMKLRKTVFEGAGIQSALKAV